jgi:hypothetical protein
MMCKDGEWTLDEWSEVKDEWFRDIDPQAYDLVLKMLAEIPTERIAAADA